MRRLEYRSVRGWVGRMVDCPNEREAEGGGWMTASNAALAIVEWGITPGQARRTLH